jgi:hypothetical protein
MSKCQNIVLLAGAEENAGSGGSLFALGETEWGFTDGSQIKRLIFEGKHYRRPGKELGYSINIWPTNIDYESVD